ncbi:hypothetical protein FIBSPDRAFT_886436 [Athelia psychrophila]|uniref:Uncharacterized protein n=1 Tax=Athelia psychrophila TaxID=1759441 RepID=A0A166QU83_9AGAM|nr:hypothetical protein FIBSPDRAFT_886436 [Fibularhizoctonia sp. CBS 109695]
MNTKTYVAGVAINGRHSSATENVSVSLMYWLPVLAGEVSDEQHCVCMKGGVRSRKILQRIHIQSYGRTGPALPKTSRVTEGISPFESCWQYAGHQPQSILFWSTQEQLANKACQYSTKYLFRDMHLTRVASGFLAFALLADLGSGHKWDPYLQAMPREGYL